jgi:hypothetical protein
MGLGDLLDQAVCTKQTELTRHGCRLAALQVLVSARAKEALAQVRDDFASKAAVDMAMMGDMAAQETHDVGTAESADAVLHQLRVDASQG